MNKGYVFVLITAFFFGTMETALKFLGTCFILFRLPFSAF